MVLISGWKRWYSYQAGRVGREQNDLGERDGERLHWKFNPLSRGVPLTLPGRSGEASQRR